MRRECLFALHGSAIAQFRAAPDEAITVAEGDMREVS